MLPLDDAAAERARRSFDERGYAVVDHFLSRDHVALLRRECDGLVKASTSSWGRKRKARDDDDDGILACHGCIFEVLQSAHGDAAAPCSLLRGDLSLAGFKSKRGAGPLLPQAADLLTSAPFVRFLTLFLASGPKHLQDEAVVAEKEANEVEGPHYFNEQYIVKPAFGGTKSSFSWHRDSDWCFGDEDVTYKPYISLWCPLDDCCEENGTLYVKKKKKNVPKEGKAESDSDDDDEVEAPLICNAGDCVVMSDRFLHRSGCNGSDERRRVWMPQFSAGKLVRKSSGSPVSFAIQL